MHRHPIVIVVAAAVLSGCSSHQETAASAQQERELIAAAMQADGFRGYARLFPRHSGTRDCEVRAGPPGNVFAGSCSTRVRFDRDGSGRVVFKQSTEGSHWWLVRVSNGEAQLVRDWGASLVEGIS